MSKASIDSVSEFLLHAGTEYKVFDLGRGISELETQQFLEIENARIPAPFPRQQHAWFAFVFWNKNASSQRFIWFVKFPVDEQGLLIAASRNHFLQIIVDALGHQLAQHDNSVNQQLPDNPYSFVPSQSLMANFNAFAKRTLNQAPVEEVQLVEEYIHNPQKNAWQTIPIQAICDAMSRINERHELADLIVKHFDQFAPQFKQKLLEASESVELPTPLKSHYVNCVATNQSDSLYALIGLSSRAIDEDIKQALRAVLNDDTQISIDLLSVIAGRHFTQLDSELILLFFEQVALMDAKENYSGALFAGFFSDLVQIPQLRAQVLTMLRSEQRSQQLSQAIGQLFSQTTGTNH